MVLAGWGLDVAWLRSGVPGWPEPTPNTALSLLAVTSAIAVACGRPGRLRRAVALVLALAAVCFPLLTLVAAIGGDAVLLERRLVQAFGVRGADPAMALPTVLAVVALAVGLIGHVSASRRRSWPAIAAGIATAIAVASLLGHLYGAAALVEPFGLRPSSPVSALALLSLAAALVVLSLPERSYRLLVSRRPASMLLRRLVPLALAALLFSGFVRLAGELAGWYDTASGTAMMVVVNAAVLILLAISITRRLDEAQRRAEHEHLAAVRYLELLERQARELNDEVIQGLSAAWLALELDDTASAAGYVRRATTQAQRIAGQQLAVRHHGQQSLQDLLTRTVASGADEQPST
jgi:hypothetical protein